MNQRRCLSRVLVTTAFLSLSLGCSPKSSPATEPPAQPTPPQTVEPAPTIPQLSSSETTPVAQGTAPTIIFHNGVLLTMEPDRPEAQAIAIAGDQILAVGSNDEIMALRGSATQLIDLEGHTLLPGFIDSHAHWVGHVLDWFPTLEASVEESLTYGWTSFTEMSANPGRLDDLLALDQAGVIRQRVNVYLPINTSVANERLGRWYLDYEPHALLSPHVRVAGIKIFTDHYWSNVINWTQQELDEEISTAHQEGWQIAIHTLGDPGHDMVLTAFERALQGESNQAYRHRIEHVAILSDENLTRVQDMDLIASIQLNWPGDWPQEEFDLLYDVLEGDQLVWVTRWRDILDRGIFVVGGSDFPSSHGPEARDPPSGSPIRLLHNAVTRIGNMDRQPDPWMLDQNIAVEEALALLTINGAYATFEENVKGSLAAGKWADLVILTENPLAVPVDALLDIRVLVTMIGGSVEYCAAEAQALCGQKVPSESAEPAVVVLPGDAIEVAVQGPVTGQLSDFYPHVWNVAQLAAADYGLVLDTFPLRLVQLDDACTQPGGADAADRLVAEHPQIVGVIGPLCSSAALGSLPVYQENGLVVVSGGATQEDLSALFGTAQFNRTILNDQQLHSLGVEADYVDERESVQSFYSRYAELYEPPPAEVRPIMAYTYDAISVLLNAIADVAAVNEDGEIVIARSELAKAVRATQGFMGLTGPIAFDERGDRIPE